MDRRTNKLRSSYIIIIKVKDECNYHRMNMKIEFHYPCDKIEGGGISSLKLT